jgi:UDP-GlcNAc:undecaprenyl-phosphate GlcNAc-1-phosphate transferase
MTPTLPSFFDLAAPASVGFIIALLSIAALRPLAIKVDLVDRPGGRKMHEGVVPVIGGLAMLLGLLVAFGVMPIPYQPSTAFTAACALLIVVGLADDRFDISPWFRLPVHAAAAGLLIFGAGWTVTGLGDLLGLGSISLVTPWAELLTLVLVMGAINAFNMLDGMDGLAGATALVGFAFMAFVSAADGLAGPLFVSIAGLGVVAAFLVFNVPALYNRAFRCFMGDAGSTLLGFVLAWLCVAVSQDVRSTISPVAVLWFVAMPIYELLWTMIRRISRGTSPFRPDAEHFHHLLQKVGFSVRGAFGVYLAICIVIGSFGLVLHEWLRVSDALLFLAFLLVGVGIVRLMYNASILARLMPSVFLAATSSSSEPPAVG